MKKSEREQYAQRLYALARDLMGQEASLKVEALRSLGDVERTNLSKVPMHLGDLSSDTYEQEVSVQLLQNERGILLEIADALQRMEQGTYGKCENCQKAIGKERLQVVPYTRYCIDCARQVEETGQISSI
jgi:RNA polymerase-binding transcription factor DksA